MRWPSGSWTNASVTPNCSRRNGSVTASAPASVARRNRSCTSSVLTKTFQSPPPARARPAAAGGGPAGGGVGREELGAAGGRPDDELDDVGGLDPVEHLQAEHVDVE